MKPHLQLSSLKVASSFVPFASLNLGQASQLKSKVLNYGLIEKSFGAKPCFAHAKGAKVRVSLVDFKFSDVSKTLRSHGTRLLSIQAGASRFSKSPSSLFSKSPSSLHIGFKKRLFFRVRALNGRLTPSFNRRKHAHSHTMLLENQARNFSKTFNYVKKKTLKFWVAEALSVSYAKKNVKSMFNGFPMSHLTHIVETQSNTLFWRHGVCKSLKCSIETQPKLNLAVANPLKMLI